MGGSVTPVPDVSAVREELEKILASTEFSQSERLSRFLRFVVEGAMEGRAQELKESVIGSEVLGRQAGYNSKIDPIVRVQAGRVRARLEAYYQGSGTLDRVRIELPKGGYVPLFTIASSEPAVAPAKILHRPARQWIYLAGIAAAIALLSVAALTRSTEPPGITVRPFTRFRGFENTPAFSPDGKTLAYQWGDYTQAHIFLQKVDSETPVRLTNTSESEYMPTWSPDGRRIAFLRRYGPDRFGVFTVGIDAHDERAHGELRHSTLMDWSPDGKWLVTADHVSTETPLVVFAISLENGGRRQLTAPPLSVLGDDGPVFSPDGSTLAFARRTDVAVEDLYIAPFHSETVQLGEPKRLTYLNQKLHRYSWAADGQSIFVSVQPKGMSPGIWQVPLNGREMKRLAECGSNAAAPAVARTGGRMAYVVDFVQRSIWRTSTKGGPGQAIITSTAMDTSPQYSPDGKRIAFRSNRSGSDEIWVTDAEGKAAQRLTSINGPITGSPRWSPDGKYLAFDSRVYGNSDVFVIPAAGGKMERFTSEASNESVPSWSRDGRWIYFASDRTGKTQIWKQPAAGGPATQVTWDGGFAPMESPDGEFLYYVRGLGGTGLYRLPARGGTEQTVLENVEWNRWGHWAVTNTGLYYFEKGTGAPNRIMFMDWKTQAQREILSPKFVTAPSDGALALSPDGQYLLYVQTDDAGSNINLVEGLP
jgi:Tol biopolymer transport system component